MSEKVNAAGQASPEYLLEVNHLCKYFNVNKSPLNRKPVYLRAVDDVSFRIRPGETLGVVGESGCGKSTLGNTIIRLLDATSGQVLFDGKDFTSLRGEELRKARANIQMIFQDPFSSLNPRMKVFDIIAEPFRTHHVCASGQQLREEVFQLMDEVGLPRSSAFRYPHEFSGGQRQRMGIARALALKPKLIICDEPVSALDVSIQAQILNLLSDLQKKFNLTYIFIAHGEAHQHQRGRDVSGQNYGVRPQEGTVLPPHAPLHGGAFTGRSHPRPHPAGRGKRPHPQRRRAQPGESAGGLPLLHPLPLCQGALPHRSPGTGFPGRQRPSGGLSLPAGKRAGYPALSAAFNGFSVEKRGLLWLKTTKTGCPA